MVSSVAPIGLTEKENPRELGRQRCASSGALVEAIVVASFCPREPFLRIPPYPQAKVRSFVQAPQLPRDAGNLVEELKRSRVGGTYWASQPEIRRNSILVRSCAALEAAREFAGTRPLVLWTNTVPPIDESPDLQIITGDCDPWHLLEQAHGAVLEANDELRLIAALLDVPVQLHNAATGVSFPDTRKASELASDALARSAFQNPFTGQPMSAQEAVRLCGFWRQLIDSNRHIRGGVGFAFWKQKHVAPLLWGGSNDFQFMRSSDASKSEGSLAIWRAKAVPRALEEIERTGRQVIEVEDGFLRSRGLGADCIPPLSVTVDRLAPHFDPARPSELEVLLQEGRFDELLVERARRLRSLIVEAGIGKYGSSVVTVERPAGNRRHILVPGQVEDDRAVTLGGCGLSSNLELLKRVREHAPDAYILFKPHPDVLAGHRRGAVADAACLQYADEVAGELPIAPLIGMIDEVHVNTSLAGFEALLRSKKVTTYGVPFYAGWGLTKDLGPVPKRRTAKRSLDELVAATLLLYPRYLDPLTGLPCPAEVVVERLLDKQNTAPGLIVGMRRLQGKLMRRLRSLIQ